VIVQVRGVDTIAVQVAHIRTPAPNGPRYSPSFSTTELDTESNLILLCEAHHKEIDEFPELYSVEKLVEWKSLQVQTAAAAGKSRSTDMSQLPATTRYPES
jgi:hypothetical protein